MTLSPPHLIELQSRLAYLFTPIEDLIIFIGVIVNMPRPTPFLVSHSVFQMISMKGKVASKPVPPKLRICVPQLRPFEKICLPSVAHLLAILEKKAHHIAVALLSCASQRRL